MNLVMKKFHHLTIEINYDQSGFRTILFLVFTPITCLMVVENDETAYSFENNGCDFYEHLILQCVLL